MRALVIAGLMLAGAAQAQTPPAAPPGGSGGGGPVGPSVSAPNEPTGRTPPGTPAANTAAGREARDAAGTAVIGKTTTEGAAQAGATDGADAGVKR